MATLDELADYLAIQGCGTVGTDLFKGVRPDAPDTLLALYEYTGNMPEYVQSSYAPTWEKPQIQVVARSASYDVARELAGKAWDALAPLTNATLSGTRYRSVRPNGSPALIMRDAHNRSIVGFNVSIVKEPSVAAVS